MNINRRTFLEKASAISIAAVFAPNFDSLASSHLISAKDMFFKISLAQWSLHRAFWEKEIDPLDFPKIAKQEFDISAVEYVNSFYTDKVKDTSYWQELKKRSADEGVENLLIMIDEEGDLGNPKDKKRQKAVKNHHKWVDIAAQLGCHSIRINAFGDGGKDEVKNALVDGLGNLATYAQKANINVLIENHGLYSSDAKWVAEVLTQIGMSNCGTLPDFGNFCLARKWGSTQDGTCPEIYDRYLGVKEMMPFAKGVSAKSYHFDEDGNETMIDFERMLKIVKDAGFAGYIGIEYEGNELSEPDGIRATKKLLERIAANM